MTKTNTKTTKIMPRSTSTKAERPAIAGPTGLVDEAKKAITTTTTVDVATFDAIAAKLSDGATTTEALEVLDAAPTTNASPYADDTSASTKHGFALVRAAAVGGVDEVERVLLSFPPRIRAKAVAIAAKHDVDARPFNDALARMPTESRTSTRGPKELRSPWFGKDGKATPSMPLRLAHLDLVVGDSVRVVETQINGAASIVITKA
jgi:hypothetical protein